MEIISVNVQKGGSGKTTTVQALAELLSKVHKKRYFALMPIRNAIYQRFLELILIMLRNIICLRYSAKNTH